MDECSNKLLHYQKVKRLLIKLTMGKNKSVLIILSAFAISVYTQSFAQQLNYSVSESYNIHDSINKSRWDIGGRLSHYSFRFMSEFFPAAIIEKPVTAFRFTEKPVKAIEQIVVKNGKDSFLLDSFLQRLHINSIIVVHKGNVVFERYYSMKPGEQHTLQSITKVLTSTLITQLVNEKKINPELPVATYLPELKHTGWKNITVKNIMNMRSGMIGSEMSENMGGLTNPQHPYYTYEEALGLLPKVDSIVPSVFDYVGSMKSKIPAGQEAEYNSMNTFILGWIAEKTTGKKYADLISEKIWQPMGASSNAYVCVSDKGVPWMHGGISATLRDLARFGMLYTHSDIRTRKESFISFLQLNEIFNTPALDLGFEKFQWGYQWDVARDGFLMKGGFGGQALVIHPEKEIVIAYFNHIDQDWGIMNMVSSRAINAIVNAIETSK